MFSYKEVCQYLTSSLPQRTKDILSCRFGFGRGKKETLEAIGKKYGITRERVRQIEKDGIKQAKKEAHQHREVFSFFKKELEKLGGVKREDLLLNILEQEKGEKNYIIFLLNISEDLFRIPENKDFYAFWVNDEKTFLKAKEVIGDVHKELKKRKKLLPLQEISAKKDMPLEILSSYLEISKIIVKNGEEEIGLYNWPEINPRGIKDKAYLALKKAGKPLHFREIAATLGEKANPQTAHNELIKDNCFVLVGRGVYALSEWGYTPGEVKEVIHNILKKEGSLAKNDIIQQVAKQRIVKKNTVIQNLSNKKYFVRTPDGKYTIA